MVTMEYVAEHGIAHYYKLRDSLNEVYFPDVFLTEDEAIHFTVAWNEDTYKHESVWEVVEVGDTTQDDAIVEIKEMLSDLKSSERKRLFDDWDDASKLINYFNDDYEYSFNAILRASGLPTIKFPDYQITGNSDYDGFEDEDKAEYDAKALKEWGTEEYGFNYWCINVGRPMFDKELDQFINLVEDYISQYEDVRSVYMMPTIKAIRTFAGLTQAAFSARFRIPKRSIENWEAGARDCPEYLRYLLALLVNFPGVK